MYIISVTFYVLILKEVLTKKANKHYGNTVSLSAMLA